MKKDLPVYKITIDEEYSDGNELGIEQIAFVKNPAIIVKGVAFSSQKVKFSTDGLKMRIAAPALIPGEIYRNDDSEYYVEFTTDEIEKIYKDFMSKLSQKKDVFNFEHTSNVMPAYVLEAMLCDTDSKLSYIKDEYGIDLPMGSMFIVSQFTDEEAYKKLVEEDRVGMSIEGFLGLSLSEIINKKEEQMKKQNFMLPDGEWEIEGKIYVVKDGEVLEVRDKAPEIEIESEEVPVEEEVKEEIVMEEAPVAEEEVVEEVVAEEAPVEEVAPEAESMKEEELMKFIEEKIDAKLQGITDMLAEMRLKIEGMAPEAEEQVEKVQMSAQEIRVQKALAFAKAFGRK
jgi:hypothetical protein